MSKPKPSDDENSQATKLPFDNAFDAAVKASISVELFHDCEHVRDVLHPYAAFINGFAVSSDYTPILNRDTDELRLRIIGVLVGSGNQIVEFDVETNAITRTIKGLASSINCISISTPLPSSNLAPCCVYGEQSGFLVIRDVHTNDVILEAISNIKHPGAVVSCYICEGALRSLIMLYVEVSPEKILESNYELKSAVYVYNTDRGTLVVPPLTDHQARVIAFTAGISTEHKHSFVASVSIDGVINVYDMYTFDLLYTFENVIEEGMIADVQGNVNENLVFPDSTTETKSEGWSASMSVYNDNRVDKSMNYYGSTRQKLQAMHREYVVAEGRDAVGIGDEKEGKDWYNEGKYGHDASVREEKNLTAVFSVDILPGSVAPYRPTLLVAATYNILKLYDLNIGEPYGRMPLILGSLEKEPPGGVDGWGGVAHTGKVYDMCLIPALSPPDPILDEDGELAENDQSTIPNLVQCCVTCGEDATIKIWDLFDGKVIRTYRYFETEIKFVRAIANPRLIVIACDWQNHVKVIDVEKSPEQIDKEVVRMLRYNGKREVE